MSAHDEDMAGFRFRDESTSGEMPSPWCPLSEKAPTPEDADDHGWVAAWHKDSGFALLQPGDLAAIASSLGAESLAKIGVQWARIEDVVTLPKEARH